MKLLTAAKAYAALAGAIITALLSSQSPDSTLFTILTVAAAVATAVATYSVPNQTTGE